MTPPGNRWRRHGSTSAQPQDRFRTLQSSTGADGRFRLSAPRSGKYRVSASSDAHGSSSVEVEVGTTDVEVVVKLVR